MAEISRIQGPSGPPESGRPGKALKKTEGQFKDEMRRVDEVSKIDPDEAKKRKRPEETFREEELSKKATAEPEKKGVETGKSFKVPESEGTTKSEREIGAEKSSAKPGTPMEHEEGLHATISEIQEEVAKEHIIKSREAEVREGATMPAAAETPEEEKKKVAAHTPTEVAPVTAPVSSTGIEPAKVEEPTPEEEIFLPEEPPPPYTHLHPDILDIFERMIGALVYLDLSGIKETTITIHSTEEKPSIFNGAQITIREYSTAPKEFNIELSGKPEAVELFQNNKKELMDAFDNIPYTFKVKNLQTSLQ